MTAAPNVSHRLPPAAHCRAAIVFHRAPDPVPADQPVPEPFDNPHPHHPPVHMPQNDDPVPDPNPQVQSLLH